MIEKIQNANRSTIAALAILLAVVLFLAVNLISSLTLTLARVDSTENKLYTLSQDTRNTLEALEDPVTLRLYLSTNLRDESPAVRLYSDRVIELLRTYEGLSGGMVRFEQIKPTPLSVEEEEATGFGIEGVTATGGEPGYFGLVGTNMVDGVEVISYLDPAQEPSLEYDLTRMIRRLSTDQQFRIGIVDGLALMRPNEETGLVSQIVQNLQVDFIVEEVPLDFTNILEENQIDAIVVVHPFGLSQVAVYAIEQYIMRGGKALIFLDVQAEHSSPAPNNPTVLQYPDSYLSPLLAQWGVEMVEDEVVGDPNLALPVQMRQTQEIINYLPWMRFGPDQFNSTDPVTSTLVAMRLSSPGALRPIPGSTMNFTPLITTTDQAGFIPQAVTMARDPSAIFQGFQPTGQAEVVAARITGTIRTAFPNGAPPLPETPQGAATPLPPPTLIAESVEPANIIVVADTDLITDDHLTPDVNNDDFVTNALESLLGEISLTELRVRALISRPFTYINEIEERAAQTYAGDIEANYAELEQVALQIDNILSRVPGGQIIALPQTQQQELADLRERQASLLRTVRSLEAQRRAEIESVENSLRLQNILIVPAVIVIFGLLVAFWRRIRLARYVRRWRALGGA